MKKSIFTSPVFRYVFEIIVIVFSVTLSFYIQDVLNKREKIEEKNRGLQGVLIELEKDRKGFEYADSYNKQRLSYIDSLFDLSYSFKSLYISGMWSNFEMLQNKRYFDGLVSTGALEFIESKQLQSELSDYYNFHYTQIKTAVFTDNLSFNRFSDRLTNYKIDSVAYNKGSLSEHHFNPIDVKLIRNDAKLKSSALDWSLYINMEIDHINSAKKKILLLKELINQEIKK